MDKITDEPLKTSLEAVGVRCRRYRDKHKPRLKSVSPSDLRPKSSGTGDGGTIWVESWDGEAHVGDMVVVAKVAPALRAANMKAIFITNPSFGPLVSSNRDVLTALPHTGNQELVRDTLETATHLTTWSHLWACAKAAQPNALKTSSPALDHDASLTVELGGEYRRSGKPLVGICWRTALIGRNPARDSHLNNWASLLDNSDYEFLSLQYGTSDLVRQDVIAAQVERGWVVQHDPRIDTIRDLPGYAAQIAACDAVVAIDCSTAYLAAGLGVRTMTLLPTVALESWGTGRACPFFPNNSIFRQVVANDWEHPIMQAADEIGSTFAGWSAMIAPRTQRNGLQPPI